MTDTATTTGVAPAVFARLVGAIERRDTLVQLVEECAASLTELAPALRATRRVFDGAWVVGLTAGGSADPVRPYSRLDFELRFDGPAVTVTCRTTVRQRDLETTSLSCAVDRDGLAQVRAFVEDRMCAFADAYFARG